MDPSSTVVQDDNVVAAVQPSSAPQLTGFDHASEVDIGGTFYPGLIQLHNHLSYLTAGLSGLF